MAGLLERDLRDGSDPIPSVDRCGHAPGRPPDLGIDDFLWSHWRCRVATATVGLGWELPTRSCQLEHDEIGGSPTLDLSSCLQPIQVVSIIMA